MKPLLVVLIALCSIATCAQRKDSIKVGQPNLSLIHKTDSATHYQPSIVDIYELMIKNQDRAITSLELLVTILGLIVGIISFSLPIAIYFFQIRPAEKILNEVKDVNSKIEVKLKEYLKTEETKRVDNAISELLSPDEKTSAEAATHLSFSQTFDFSESHLAKIYIALKSDIDFNKKSILLMILSKKQSEFGDEYFRSLIKSETETQSFLYYCLRYFCVSGIEKYLSVIGEYILTANNVTQNVNSIAGNYVGVAATLLSISRKAFVSLVNYQILNNGLDTSIKKNIVASLEHSVKFHNAESDLKNSILYKV